MQKTNQLWVFEPLTFLRVKPLPLRASLVPKGSVTPNTKVNMAKSILARTETGEIQLTNTIPVNEIQKAYEEAFDAIARETQMPGFRKGMAPKKLVEEKTDKTKIYEQVLQKIVPQAYLEAVKEHKISPVIPPKVELLKAKEGEDWEVRATTCEKPKVQLGDYKEEIRKALSPTKIWTPENKQETDEKKETTEDEKTQKVIEVLLQTAKVDLPNLLVEDELTRTLSNLLSQTEKLGLTIDQYLSSIGKTVEELRGEYRTKIENDLKLQFILNAVIDEEKINVEDKEVDALIEASGDEKIKQDLNSPLNRAYLQGILARRKALDFLGKI